jgi:hypothetical protein
VLLLGVILRAAGVALLIATLLLPATDHHMADRRPDRAAHAMSQHDLASHHHIRGHARSANPLAWTPDPARPLVGPVGPIVALDRLVGPLAHAGVDWIETPRQQAQPLDTAIGRPVTPATRPPPRPPPNHHA